MSTSRVSVVVVTYGRQPLLVDCVNAICQSVGVTAEVVIVDNGHDGDEVSVVEGYDEVTVIRPGANTGFAGGCNLGADRATSEFVVFINPDAIVAPEAIAQLIQPLVNDEVQVTTAAVLLLREPHLINAVGNRIHPCGVSWCGEFRKNAALLTKDIEPLLASGAAMACKREWWNLTGGFQEEFFAYYEDTEFSLRTIMAGGKIRLVHDAIVLHDYEFSKNPTKMFLVDRNRMMLVASLYRPRTLLVLSPLLLVHEIALCVFAIAGGWAPQRLRALKWMVSNREMIRRVRSRLQASRRIGDAAILRRMEVRLLPENLQFSRGAVVLQSPLEWLTRALRRVILVLEPDPVG